MSTVKVKFRDVEVKLQPWQEVLRPCAVKEDDKRFDTLGIENQLEIDKGQRGRPFKTFVFMELPNGERTAALFFQYIKPQRLVKKIEKERQGKIINFAYMLDTHTSNLFFYNKKGILMESFDTRVLYSYKDNLVTIQNKRFIEPESKIIEGKERLRGKFVGECV
jgi:hypothetical protein